MLRISWSRLGAHTSRMGDISVSWTPGASEKLSIVDERVEPERVGIRWRDLPIGARALSSYT